jgi:hypothetical protein
MEGMKVRMKTILASPTQNAKPRQVIEVSEEEAQDLIAGGFAEAVPAPRLAETVAVAVAPSPVETATAPPAEAKAVAPESSRGGKPKPPKKGDDRG